MKPQLEAIREAHKATEEKLKAAGTEALLAAFDLAAAVRYVLNRAQVDDQLGYLLGPHTEAWEKLVGAEARWLGVDPDKHRDARAEELS